MSRYVLIPQTGILGSAIYGATLALQHALEAGSAVELVTSSLGLVIVTGLSFVSLALVASESSAS